MITYFITASYLAYLVFVLVKVAVDDTYTAKQKTMQIVICLFIPIVGVIICHVFSHASDSLPKPAGMQSALSAVGNNHCSDYSIELATTSDFD